MDKQPAKFADLDGASVFITGGGSGIGATLTRGFLEQGAKVAFIGRSDHGEFVDEVERETGKRPLFIQGDVTDTPVLHDAIDRAEAAHGPLDVLVSNAANDQRTDPMEVTPEQWDELVAVNFRHFFFAAQRAARSMKGRGGSIINMSSISHVMGVPDLNVYAPANAGVSGMTRSLARAWGGDRIRVNAILPGMVLTEKQLEKWLSEDDIDQHVSQQALQERLYPEDMVGPVLFLASRASHGISAQSIVVDGGFIGGGI
ncbi:Short-chain dehydrogenase/reductase SDR [Oceanicola granulosus HTCC2516]|uniref:Short-chain dehydrogenase/reductase SDR n=1 Tax=Oceanicola granulosus (strain ATCC BAA-861 / DSM 15982 / KCTC 12143 / HTCC2516) TaxID=314256 RepID=Q2CB38_OCEGH|nr:SDR family oxidoreductase [Oceanicola granulosus]EAR49892.1 Short-chain dehydrogenase/reductase SDR [Oceanicola granulosus HTCC2516]